MSDLAVLLLPILSLVFGFGLATAYWSPKVTHANQQWKGTNQQWKDVAERWEGVAKKNEAGWRECLDILQRKTPK